MIIHPSIEGCNQPLKSEINHRTQVTKSNDRTVDGKLTSSLRPRLGNFQSNPLQQQPNTAKGRPRETTYRTQKKTKPTKDRIEFESNHRGQKKNQTRHKRADAGEIQGDEGSTAPMAAVAGGVGYRPAARS
jgi:hypothetical protein